ncbi:MAG: LysR family transcriptional regulator [Gammaproteobacteria bacterium]|nr:LysR family transcriptional regulator [Gammaproteobacteria bacterium]MYK81765.1 LysR family transcriptional regulator [Gammaproteobacteria bacterium]
MNLRDLKYLVALAEHRHFGRAADACFVSQPTLSTQLKKLEETLGVTLIERNRRRVILTPVGESIVAQADTVLQNVDQLLRLADEHRDPLGGDFRLGLIPTLAPYLLPLVLAPVRRALPKLRMQITEGQTARITGMLRAGALDAVVLALPLPEEDLVQTPIFDEPFHFAVSVRHPKASRAAIDEAELEQEEVLLLEDGHCLRDQALAICKSRNAVENTDFRATSLETLRQMVAADVGVTLMPELAITDAAGGVRYIPFSGTNPPHRTIGVCWRSSATRTPLLKELTEVLTRAVDRALV